MAIGNLLVGQSGGCTAVINQSLLGIIETARTQRAIGNVWGMRNGILGVLNNKYVDLSRLNSKERVQLGQTPSSALGSCRHKMSDTDCNLIVAKMKKKNIRYFLLIGGNDTAQTSKRIAEHARAQHYEINVIAVPKTIDNDLPCMDHTPGNGSAAQFIASTTQEAGLDTEAMKYVDPIKIIEVMGRNSGWLVAAAALAKRSKYDAPHLVYFPERAFRVDEFVTDVTRVYKQIGYAVIIISETIRDHKNRRIGERTTGINKDSFGHKYVEGTAARLCEIAENALGVRARFDKPGTIARMSMAYISAVDQREAYAVGKKAVQLAVNGESEVMVTLKRSSKKPYRCTTGMVSVDRVAGVEKYLPSNFINTRGNFVTKAFLDYARPLTGPLPTFLRL